MYYVPYNYTCDDPAVGGSKVRCEEMLILLQSSTGQGTPPWGRFGKRIVKVEPLKTNEFLNENQCENHYEDDGKE